MSVIQKHNFGAGPCILPQPVLNSAAEAVKCWEVAGLSLLEISHRSPEFETVVKETEQLVRELLAVPDDYCVLFLQGGASMQFCMLAMNFLNHKSKAAYLDAGYFGQKAIKEAGYFGEAKIVASSKDKDYNYIPQGYTVPKDCAYFHCTSNNTIEGTQMHNFPETDIPVICDMSSDIFSREIDITKFDLIYAGAQKNMGPAGMTLVIAKKDFIDSANKAIPAILNYRVYRDNQSMYNTPPVFSIYTAMLNLQWLKSQGGVPAIANLNRKKAEMLYKEIDRNPLFYGTAEIADRSVMNVTFKMHDTALEPEFLKFAVKHGMVGIKGYRTRGGFRASLYNALPIESVQALVNCMKKYQETTVGHTSFQPAY